MGNLALFFGSTVALVFVVGCSADTFAAVDAGSDAGSDAKDASAPAEAGTFECRSAGDCGGLKPLCCGTFELGAGTLPKCPLSGASTKCQAACETQIPLSCPNPGRVKICRDSADCDSDLQNKRCCNIFAGGLIGSVCASDLLANLAISCN